MLPPYGKADADGVLLARLAVTGRLERGTACFAAVLPGIFLSFASTPASAVEFCPRGRQDASLACSGLRAQEEGAATLTSWSPWRAQAAMAACFADCFKKLDG